MAFVILKNKYCKSSAWVAMVAARLLLTVSYRGAPDINPYFNKYIY